MIHFIYIMSIVYYLYWLLLLLKLVSSDIIGLSEGIEYLGRVSYLLKKEGE